MAKLSAFQQAFADARKSGDKEFSFNGKKFNTKLANDEPQSVGGKPKLGEYKPRDSVAQNKAAEEAADAIDPGADPYFSQKLNMSGYKPRRTPEPLSSTVKPGTRTNYENTETSDMSYKKGGKVSSASRRADGIASKGKTRCKMC